MCLLYKQIHPKPNRNINRYISTVETRKRFTAGRIKVVFRFLFVVWSQFVFGSLPLHPQFETTNLVVYPKYQFGNLPPPQLPRFDQNFLDTGLGFASQRIFLRKTNKSVKSYCLVGGRKRPQSA